MQKNTFSRTLQIQFLQINGVKTAFYTNFSDSSFCENFPTLLLVHGINGSHFGLEFLAGNLAKDFNLILVDLPGHGKSDIGEFSKDPSISNLRTWFSVVVEFSRKLARNTYFGIISHSFGCYAISPEISRKYPVIFICPVPTVPNFSRRIGKLLVKLFTKKRIARSYNWTPLSALRGDMMLKNASRENRLRQYFIAESDRKTSPKFREFQAILATSAFHGENFCLIEPRMVIYGKYDFVPTEKTHSDFKTVFPNATIREIPSGHLPTTEQPELLAKIIRENLLKWRQDEKNSR